MALEKAQLQPLNVDGTPKGARIDVLFNPAEYSIQKSNQFAETPLLGLPTPIRQFTSGGAEALTLDLFFDTYERGEDVRLYTEQVAGLLQIDPDLHAPPTLKFIWGKLEFKCVLEQVTKKFTMFLADGVPVRATLSVTFKEYKTIQEQLQSRPLQSADRTKRRIAQEGDSLWLIAAQEYDDPTLWRPIAEKNELANPRFLTPGMELTIPPLER
jgi:Contractile injection system tube protein/LysM domain